MFGRDFSEGRHIHKNVNYETDNTAYSDFEKILLNIAFIFLTYKQR